MPNGRDHFAVLPSPPQDHQLEKERRTQEAITTEFLGIFSGGFLRLPQSMVDSAEPSGSYSAARRMSDARFRKMHKM